ncbi:MAG: aminoacyl-tRNA hydrolase [Defluviitaleaceae bacterium]|nr:aminoacyl-tRNA hydrolase [Defluviitaleaceae bacterium]
MKLIVGLGNPEKNYKNTRHNIGFEVINKLSFDYNININKAKFRSHIGEGLIAGQKVILLKPQTYMNLSGEAVRDIMKFYKLSPEDLIVVYDEVALPVGDIRIRLKGSAGGQNGMKNIIYHLETDEFVRIRVGIGEKPARMVLSDYVLSKFNKNEHDDMVLGVTKATDAIHIIFTDSVNNAMNKFNKKLPNPKEVEDVE